MSQYVAFTRRHALVQEFVPTADEQRLYDLVSDYLQSLNLYALPSSQRQLMTLMLRKLLASSTYAISDSLAGLAAKLEEAERMSDATAVSLEDFAENFELMPEIEEEWEEEDEAAQQPSKQVTLTKEQRQERRAEIVRLREFHELARGIHRNSKGEQLLTALQRGFAAAAMAQTGDGGALQQKALLFTESRRTQEYLYRRPSTRTLRPASGRRVRPPPCQRSWRWRRAAAFWRPGDEAWRAYDDAARAVDARKDALIDEIAARLKQTETVQELFTIRWQLR